MTYRFQIAALLVLSAFIAFVAIGAEAQMVASHAPTSASAAAASVPSNSFPEASKAVNSGADASALQVTGRTVVKVNGIAI
jgi:hypothetical protein